MKKSMLILFSLVLLGCQQDLDIIEEDTSSLSATKAVTSISTSDVFDWEKIQKIDIAGYGTSIVLPWYNAGSSHLPFYITENYKKEDGWLMQYNFCTDQNEIQKNRYYLIFYNVFTGIMRTYYYNPTSVTGGSTTLWSTSLDKSTSLLNATGYFAIPISKPQNNPTVYSSNLTTHGSKSLTPNWNAYDVEFAYDPNFDNNRSNLHMSIGGYDITTSNITLAGDISLTSEGTMVTKTTVGASSTPQQNITNSVISAVGSSAMGLVSGKIIGKDNKSFFPNLVGSAAGAIASGGITEVVKFGVNLVFGSFLGRGSKPQVQTSNSDINLKTNGTLTISGTITSNSAANISGITNLLVPGATASSLDRLQPAYNKPLGVWNLKEEPIVEYSDEKIYVSYSYGPSIGWSDYSTLRYMDLKPNSVNVILNPAVLENVSRYTIDSEMVYYGKLQGKKGLDGIVNITNEGYTMPAKITPFFNDPTPGAETIIYRNGYLSYPTVSSDTYFSSNQRWNKPGDDRHIRVYATTGNGLPTDDVAIKVTVTLYPKAGYNQDPIISTRTFLPKFEKIYGKYDYMKSF